MITIAATVAVSLAVGIAAERRFGTGAQRVARLLLDAMLYVIAPFVTFFSLARLQIGADVGGGIALALVALTLTGVAAHRVARHVLGLSRPGTGALMVATLNANTGFLGLPLVVAVFGRSRLGEAVAFDVLVSAPVLLLGCFGIGAAFGTAAAGGIADRVRAFALRNPVLLAAAAGLLAPDSLAPDSLVHAARVVVMALAPLGFFAVGVTLAAEAEVGTLRVPPRLTRPVAAATVLRLGLAPALLAALALPLISLPTPYLVLAAMPSGINGLVIAHAFGLDLRLCAGAIAWTTSIVLAVGLGIAAVQAVA